jgi:hypothetical protein
MSSALLTTPLISRFAMFQQASKEIGFVLNKLESICILESNEDEDVLFSSTVFER